VNIRWLATLMLASLTIASVSGQQNWPQFRGANAGVIADNAALPETWSATENVVWKTAVPGLGWSSPVVWGDHVFLTAGVNTGAAEPFKAGPLRGGDIVKPAAPYRWMVYDISLETGKIRWQQEVRAGLPADGTHMKNSYSSETPVTDGERVYAYFESFGLYAYDFEGKLLWEKDLGDKRMRNEFGEGSTPTLHGNTLVVVWDHQGGESTFTFTNMKENKGLADKDFTFQPPRGVTVVTDTGR